MPAETLQRPSGVAFSWPNYPYQKRCIVCVWKACWRLKQNSKDCQAFLFTMMLLSLVSEEVYFPCVLFVELPLIECTKPCLNEGINKITDCKCLWSPASPFSFCDRHASRNVVAETVRRGWRFLSVCIVCGRLWQNKGNENHINFTWKPHENYVVKESTVVWWCLTWFAFNWSPSVSFVLLFDLFWATNLQASLLCLSKDFQAWFASVQAQQIMYLSEIVSC